MTRYLILVFVLSAVFLTSAQLSAQTRSTFDVATFSPPSGWKKQLSENAVQYTTEDTKTGTSCIIMLTKATPGLNDSKANFDAAWQSLVKEMVTVTNAPEMQTAETKDGWESLSGFAPFELEGTKGVAVLVTATGFQKMVNLVILTNSSVFETDISDFIASISLKKPALATQKPESVSIQKPAIPTAAKSAFAFNTTNFDDGWTSTVQEDWVEVVKGNIKVLIHYPKQGTIFPADPEPLTNAAWNILVAPRYRNLKNYKTSYLGTYDRAYLAMGNAADNISGKEVFVLFLRQGNSGWLEFIAPDKNSFIQQYKFDPEAIRWDSNDELLKPLAQMMNYNKFAVAQGDFTGTWTSDFTGVQQMYNVYTGNYAGMNMNQSNEEFVFGSGNSYSWKLLVVNGMVGSIKVANVSSAGKFNVLNNWQVHFSKIESGAKTYNAHWTCIKGARLLNLLNANFPGSGVYTIYGKK